MNCSTFHSAFCATYSLVKRFGIPCSRSNNGSPSTDLELDVAPNTLRTILPANVRVYSLQYILLFD